jgi:hypothetical protein
MADAPVGGAAIADTSTDQDPSGGSTESGEGTLDIGFAEFAHGDLKGQLEDTSKPREPAQAPEPPGAAPPAVETPVGTPQAQHVDPDAPPPVAAPAVEQPPAPAEISPMDRLADAVAQAGSALPPEVNQAITQTMAEFSDYERQLGEYGAQQEEKFQAVMRYESELDAIAADPRFKQALAMVQGGATPPAPGNGQPAAPPAEPPAHAWESEGERVLAGKLEASETRLSKMEADHNRRDDEYRAERRSERKVQIGQELNRIHESLDSQYPSLLESPVTRRAWDDEAAIQFKATMDMGGGKNIPAAYEKAAKILTADLQRAEGGKSVLKTAKHAASMARPPVRGPHSASPQNATTMQGCFEEAKAEMGAP